MTNPGSPPEPNFFEMAERVKREYLAWQLARSNAPRIMGLIDERQQAIIRRFLPDEQEFIRSDWNTSRQVVAACLPDVIEALFDAAPAELLEDLTRRCTRTPTDTPPPSSSGDSPSSG